MSAFIVKFTKFSDGDMQVVTLWSRIISAWAVLIGKAFATNYTTAEQIRYWDCTPFRHPDLPISQFCEPSKPTGEK